jgi:hypothetical protein
MGMNNVIALPLTFRVDDPDTSKQAPTKAKRMTAMYQLLGVYCLNDVTDEEAVELLLGPTAHRLPDHRSRTRCLDGAPKWVTSSFNYGAWPNSTPTWRSTPEPLTKLSNSGNASKNLRQATRCWTSPLNTGDRTTSTLTSSTPSWLAVADILLTGVLTLYITALVIAFWKAFTE